MMDLYLYALLTFFYVVLWIVVIRQAQWIGWGIAAKCYSSSYCWFNL